MGRTANGSYRDHHSLACWHITLQLKSLDFFFITCFRRSHFVMPRQTSNRLSQILEEEEIGQEEYGAQDLLRLSSNTLVQIFNFANPYTLAKNKIHLLISHSLKMVELGDVDCRMYYRQSGRRCTGSLILQSRFQLKRMNTQRQDP